MIIRGAPLVWPASAMLGRFAFGWLRIAVSRALFVYGSSQGGRGQVSPRLRLWLAGICTAALVVGVGVSINQVLNNGVVNWGWLTAAMVFAGLGVATGGWATRERPL